MPTDDETRIFVSAALAATILLAPLGTDGTVAHGGEDYATLEKLGGALFDDPNLSMNRTMACSTCHMQAAGFSDARESEKVGRDVSLGDDGISLGDRNAPTAAYARFTPPFGRNAAGEYVGGQFWDGRASLLEDQAGGPPLNPLEMGMPDKTSVVKRLRENPDYVAAFGTQFGKDVFESDDTAYAAMTKALASFERSDEFSTFDSKYDRFLRGEEKLTEQEEPGSGPDLLDAIHQLQYLPRNPRRQGTGRRPLHQPQIFQHRRSSQHGGESRQRLEAGCGRSRARAKSCCGRRSG